MTDKVKVGVIGVGQIGKRHVATYAGMPNVEIVAVADLNQAEAKRVAQEHGIARSFTNFRDLLALPSRSLVASAFTLEDESLVSPSPFVEEVEAAPLERRVEAPRRHRVPSRRSRSPPQPALSTGPGE